MSETDQQRIAEPEQGGDSPERHRDAGTGRMVTAEDAAARPDETVSERRDHPTRREVDAVRMLLTGTLARDLRDGDKIHRTQAEAHASAVDRIHDLRAGISAALTLLKPG